MSNRMYATQRRIIPVSSTISVETMKEPRSRNRFRPVSVRIKPFEGPAGSAYVELGKTKVVCTVNGPKEQSSDSPEGVLTVTLRGAESVPDAKNTIQAALEATICMKKLARTELSVELSVLANDGGIVAAALIAAGLALSSASIEQFDLLLACHIMVDPRNGECTLDPEMEQIRSCTFKPALITTGVIPSLGQIACLDVGGAPLSLPVLKRAIRVGYDYCLQLYTPISKYLIAYVESSNPTSSSPSPEPM